MLPQVKDELAAVGETIPDLELVWIALKGFKVGGFCDEVGAVAGVRDEDNAVDLPR